MNKIRVGVLKETKVPIDRRVAIPPEQAVEILKKFPNVELVVQPSDIRGFADSEYIQRGIVMQNDISDCDILIGVKEVDYKVMIPNKTYIYFSHTAKKQGHNRVLLQENLKKSCTLIDYEYLTDREGVRLVAFGRWAGIVGAYNGMIAYGKRTKSFDLPRMFEHKDMEAFNNTLKKIKLPAIKILITGGGRVAHGAIETLEPLNVKQVSPQDFLSHTYDEPVFAQIDPWHYTRRKDGTMFDFKHFLRNPHEYDSAFEPYTKVADVLIACHYWDPRSPVFITPEEMTAEDFKIKVIADVSCDINGPIPSTLRPSTIDNPFYGYNPHTREEGDAFDGKNISVMAVDNLPGEVPRYTSEDFAKTMIEKVMPSLFGEDSEEIILRATITKNGKLTKQFSYLQDFADEKD